MKNVNYLLIIIFLIFTSCQQTLEREITNYQYYNISRSDTLEQAYLFAVTDEEFLQYGSRVAYVNNSGDTIIPFNKYAYYGTDTLKSFANVILHPNDSTWGRIVAIDRNQNLLFDVVIFDNGPDPFNEGLTRVIRNGKMGYANRYGQVIIPCIYDYAKWFKNETAEVTFDAVEYLDEDGHRRVESNDWFEIDKQGNRLRNPQQQ
ncbi:MAG: WG repeat-containing protein [Candidatus Cyclobacteriaceae bacterium M2_1C_046]